MLKKKKRQCLGKKKKEAAHESTKEEEEEKKKNWTNCSCASARGHFCLLNNLIFFLQFSLHFGEKTFW